MFKVNIANSSQNLSWSASFSTQQEAQSWLNSQIGKPHRLPEREVPIESEYAQEDVLEVIEEEIEGVMQQTKVRLRAQFTSEIVDISAQVATEAAQAAARKLLADTDWMVIRKADTGVDYPQEIKDQRAAARLLL
jgi:hypothetical protein